MNKDTLAVQYAGDELAYTALIDHTESMLTTSDMGAEVAVHCDDSDSVYVTIGGQWFTRKDLKELITFLKLVRKGLPK